MNQSEVDLAWIAYNAYKEAYKREYGLSHVYPEFPELSHGKRRMWRAVALTIKAALKLQEMDKTSDNDYRDV